jgi:hypothetical protein
MRISHQGHRLILSYRANMLRPGQNQQGRRGRLDWDGPKNVGARRQAAAARTFKHAIDLA